MDVLVSVVDSSQQTISARIRFLSPKIVRKVPNTAVTTLDLSTPYCEHIFHPRAPQIPSLPPKHTSLPVLQRLAHLADQSIAPRAHLQPPIGSLRSLNSFPSSKTIRNDDELGSLLARPSRYTLIRKRLGSNVIALSNVPPFVKGLDVGVCSQYGESLER